MEMTKTQHCFKVLLRRRWTELLHEMREYGGDDERVARYCTAFYTYAAYMRRLGAKPVIDSPYYFLHYYAVL